MKVRQKKNEGGKILFEAVASPSEVDEAFMAAHLLFAQQMNLRPEKDKTPAMVAEEQLGVKDLDSVVEPQAAEYLIPFVLDKKNVIPSFPPEVVSRAKMVRGRDYTFEIEVTEKPEYELSSYEPVSIKMPPMQSPDQEVENQIAQMAESYAEYVKDDPRPVEAGDSVLLEIKASKDGEDMPGLSTEGRTYTAGGGFMPDGFDSQIIGMDVGETKSFSFTGPGLDENNNEIEETIDCTVTVKEMQKKVIPAVTDEWVKKFMPMYDNVENMKKAIASQYENAYKEEYESYKRQLAASELAKRFEGKIDDPVYESMQQTLINNMRMRLQQQGMTMEQYVEQNGGEQQFSMMMMMQTRQTRIEGYSLDALFRHEKMAIDDEDIMEACKAMNPQQPLVVKEQMERTGCGFALRETAQRLKASKWLVEHSEVTVEG